MEVPKWKQSKEIEGVSLSSLIDFKATIAEEKHDILSGRPNKIRKVDVDDIPKNKGILDHNQRRLTPRCSIASPKG
jgi:hypothetical protein